MSFIGKYLRYVQILENLLGNSALVPCEICLLTKNNINILILKKIGKEGVLIHTRCFLHYEELYKINGIIVILHTVNSNTINKPLWEIFKRSQLNEM